MLDQRITAIETLSVALAGSGSGSVTGSGIDCPGTCSAAVDQGSTVMLTASAASGSSFTGWSGGACSGTGGCQLTVSAATLVTATFVVPAPPRGHLSAAKIKAALSAALKLSRKRGKAKSIVKVGGYATVFDAPIAGRLRVDWYATVKRKQVLIASVSRSLTHTGNTKVEIRLTRRGRKLLGHAKRITITAKGFFTPTGASAATRVTKKLTL